MSRRVLLLGWSAADWRLLHPLLDAGELPVLERLVNGGAAGTLTAPQPFIPAMLWTTATTGRPPEAHGILAPYEMDPLSGTARPPGCHARRVPAVWDILAGAGIKTCSIGWPVTHPAQRMPGVAVSDRFAIPTAPAGFPWPVVADAVSPQSLLPSLLELRLHPGELQGPDLQDFVPLLASIPQDQDRRLVPLAVALAETITVHAVATQVLTEQSWDFAAVHYSLAGALASWFHRYAPPRLSWVSEEDFQIYGGVMRTAWRLLDSMLGTLWQLAGEETRVLLFSEHGLVAGEQRTERSAAKIGQDRWYRAHGMLALAGPGLRRDALLHGAHLLDVAPTLLALCGVAPARDMPGRVLVDAFETPPSLERVASWDTVQTANVEEDSTDMVSALAELGYEDPVSSHVSAALQRQAEMEAFNLAMSKLAGGAASSAIEPLQTAVAHNPQNLLAKLHLGRALITSERLDECEILIAELEPQTRELPLERGLTLLLTAMLRVAQRRIVDARETLRAAAGLNDVVEFHWLTGEVYRLLPDHAAAETAFRRAIECDPDFSPAWVGLAAVLLPQQKYQAAADAALEATGLDFHLAYAHYLLGLALIRLERLPLARQALRNSVMLNRDFSPASNLFAMLERQRKEHD